MAQDNSNPALTESCHDMSVSPGKCLQFISPETPETARASNGVMAFFFDDEVPHEIEWDDWERALGIHSPSEHQKSQNPRRSRIMNDGEERTCHESDPRV